MGDQSVTVGYEEQKAIIGSQGSLWTIQLPSVISIWDSMSYLTGACGGGRNSTKREKLMESEG